MPLIFTWIMALRFPVCVGGLFIFIAAISSHSLQQLQSRDLANCLRQQVAKCDFFNIALLEIFSIF